MSNGDGGAEGRSESALKEVEGEAGGALAPQHEGEGEAEMGDVLRLCGGRDGGDEGKRIGVGGWEGVGALGAAGLCADRM